LGSLTIDGVDIDGGDISYDEFVDQFVTNETAINASIAALTTAAYLNETAINSSISSLTAATLPGTLINTSYGLKNESGKIIINLTANKGLEFGTGAAEGALQGKAGDGIDLGATGFAVDVTDIIYTSEGLYEQGTNNIAINLTEDGGLGFGLGADAGALIVCPYYGLKTTSNGLEVNITADKGLEFGTGAADGALQIKLDGSTLTAGASGLKVADDTFAGEVAAYTNETAINTTLSRMLSGSSSINASATISTVLTAADLETVYPMDGSGGSVTLTLPDAATNAGRVYVITMAADMEGNNVVVDTTGAGNLGGSSGPDSLTTTDGYAATLTVVSDGTNYLILNKDGTWS